MRLVDADELKEEIEFHPTSVSVCMTVEEARGRTAQKIQCLEDIDNAPTIAAIPLSWQTEQEYGGDEELSVAANTVVKAWLTREQEAQK